LKKSAAFIFTETTLTLLVGSSSETSAINHNSARRRISEDNLHVLCDNRSVISLATTEFCSE